MSDKFKDDDFVFKKFSLYLESAKKNYQKLSIENYNAFALSTSINNFPSSRMVLLKSFSKKGFVFYTNEESRKGIEILQNPNVSMLFYWEIMHMQIRVEGVCLSVDNIISDEYFNSRSYLSKIGAWASSQSREMSHPLELSKNVLSYSMKYKTNVPRPPYWGGFNIVPSRIEFWVQKPSRLHIRKVYKKIKDNIWIEKTLFP
jgi:pyridoxamine 5'-phosphate oxidase